MFSGSLEGTAITEHILEHISHVVKRPSDQVRLSNMVKNHPCIQLTAEIKAMSDYDSRLKEVEVFNQVEYN